MSNTDNKMFQLAFCQDKQSENVEELLSVHGVEEELRNAIHTNLDNIKDRVQPFAEINPITKNEWNLDGRLWKVIDTPGHSQGHICFYQEADRILLAGDMILDKVTPNISLWPGGSKCPLTDYLRSLYKLKNFSINVAWPGHGELIIDVNNRIQEIIDHHHH